MPEKKTKNAARASTQPTNLPDNMLGSISTHLIKSLPGSIYWKDKEGKYLGCNHQVLEMAGMESIKDKTDFEMPWAEIAQTLRDNDLKVMKLNSLLELEETLTLANGQRVTVLTHKAPLYDEEGRVIGIIGNSLNITERKKQASILQKKVEQAEAASRAKTEFVENLRHDIRTPLTGIVGFSDIIKSAAEEPQIKEYADNLIASSHALLDLMDEVLEAIQVGSGDMPRINEKLVLKHLMQHAVDLNKAKAASKHLELVFDFDNEIPTYLLGDSVRIHRIVIELIANALNFTDTGFVKLSVKLANRHNREAVIKIIVQDSGIGIPTDKQEAIFLHFKRLTPSNKEAYKGAGLGLSIVKQFIDDLNGEIYVESEVQKGSAFTCVIPLKISLLEDNTGLRENFDSYFVPLSSQLHSAGNPPGEARKREEPRHILLVEDNTVAQTAAKSILSQLGCRCDIATNGQEALQLWKKNKYDLIFMDIGLPDKDGYQITHHIRVQEVAKNFHTPIIALTAHMDEENKQRCIEAGMNAVVSKPLSLKNCRELLNAFISQKKESSVSSAETFNLSTTENNLFELSAFPILDITEGTRITGSEATLSEMLKVMLTKSLPEDILSLRKAHDAQDWEQMQQITHKIKGGVIYIGAIRLKMACTYLEQHPSSKKHLIEPLYQQLLRVAEESLLEFKKWIQEQDS